MTDAPEGEPTEQPIEFEDVEGIKVDTRCSEEDKRYIKESVERFLQWDPDAKNREATELEHVIGGSSVSLTPDPFMPMALILGKEPEDVVRKRESGRKGGCFSDYTEEEDLASYATVIVTDRGWKWLVERVKEVYAGADLPEAPASYKQVKDKEDFGGRVEWYKAAWPRIIATGLVFREERHTLGSDHRIKFPNIIKVGIIKGVDLDPSHPYKPDQHGEIVYYESDLKQINRPSRRVVPTTSQCSWQIFDPDNYRIEYHPEWKPDYDMFKF